MLGNAASATPVIRLSVSRTHPPKFTAPSPLKLAVDARAPVPGTRRAGRASPDDSRAAPWERSGSLAGATASGGAQALVAVEGQSVVAQRWRARKRAGAEKLRWLGCMAEELVRQVYYIRVRFCDG